MIELTSAKLRSKYGFSPRCHLENICGRRQHLTLILLSGFNRPANPFDSDNLEPCSYIFPLSPSFSTAPDEIFCATRPSILPYACFGSSCSWVIRRYPWAVFQACWYFFHSPYCRWTTPAVFVLYESFILFTFPPETIAISFSTNTIHFFSIVRLFCAGIHFSYRSIVCFLLTGCRSSSGRLPDLQHNYDNPRPSLLLDRLLFRYWVWACWRRESGDATARFRRWVISFRLQVFYCFRWELNFSIRVRRLLFWVLNFLW